MQLSPLYKCDSCKKYDLIFLFLSIFNLCLIHAKTALITNKLKFISHVINSFHTFLKLRASVSSWLTFKTQKHKIINDKI